MIEILLKKFQKPEVRELKIYLKIPISFLIFLLMIFALSGPAVKKKNVDNFKLKSPVVFALDMSKSMLKSDITPNRLIRAKMKIQTLLENYKGSDVGIVLFTDEAFPVLPLTNDSDVIKNFLTHIKPNIMPTYEKKNIAGAINQSVKLLQSSNVNFGSIVLLTDAKYVNNSDLDAAKNATKMNYKIFTVNVFKDANKTLLDNLSSCGDGKSFLISFSFNEMKEIFFNLNNDFKKMQKQIGYEEIGLFFLLPLLILIPFVFRNSILFFLFLLPLNLSAKEFSDFFLNHNQQALKAIKNNDFNKAKKVANGEELSAIADYKLGNYKLALEKFNALENSQFKDYNLGNTYAMLGEYDKAIKNYNQALEKDPKFKKAIYNKKVLEEMDKQKQNQQQKSQNNNNNNSKNKNNDSNQKKTDENKGKENKERDKKNSKENEKQNKNNDSNQKKVDENLKKEMDKQNNKIMPVNQDSSQKQKNLLGQVKDSDSNFLREKLKLDYLKRKGYNYY